MEPFQGSQVNCLRNRPFRAAKQHALIGLFKPPLEVVVRDYDPEKIGKQMLEMKVKLQNEHISHMLSDKRNKYVIRSLRKSETELLKDFLYEAIFIPEGVQALPRSIINKPELQVYV